MLPCLQLRVSSLQELVYKQGSAGITKATVSIVFDNHDKANSPSGYEDKDYLTITRQVGRPAAWTCTAVLAVGSSSS
jgi:chromosome segregation ATPase